MLNDRKGQHNERAYLVNVKLTKKAITPANLQSGQGFILVCLKNKLCLSILKQ